MKDAEFYSHPIFDPLSFKIKTNEVERLRTIIMQWIWTGGTGGYILGEPRCGKTTAIEMLRDKIKAREGAIIPSHIYSVSTTDKSTINSTYRNLCFSADLTIPRACDADYLKKTFSHYLLDKVATSDTRSALLIVDEMQLLRLKQFEVFAELYNYMRLNRVSLFVLFIGNSYDSKELLKSINSKDKSHIYGRFFTRSGKFSGIKNIDDLEFCLKQFDSLKYPNVYGNTYTQFFLPKTQKSWKLASISKLTWDVFKEYKKLLKLKSWPMQYFISAMTALLTEHIPSKGAKSITAEVVRGAIEASGMVPQQVRGD